MAAKRKPASPANTAATDSQANFVSEWFGHRVYPVIAATPDSLAGQQSGNCPFITAATGQPSACIKPASSAGICTISSCSNGARQDWLVCPFRALGDPLLDQVARRLFLIKGQPEIIAAPALEKPDLRQRFMQSVAAGGIGIVYLQDKLGGEISVSRTKRSPELSFDTTMVEIVRNPPDRFAVARYGILEVQTMDFHGSYRAAVKNLQDALRLHRGGFHAALAQNPQWLSERIEGPNIANVFKRTFYQMMLKFHIGAHEPCVGCVLAIPASVWDSWQRHLGCPDLIPRPDGTVALIGGGIEIDPDWKVPAWIYVFDIEPSTSNSPNPINIRMVIATDADAVGHYALKVVPDAAVAVGGAFDRVLATIHRRLRLWWPDLQPRQIGEESEALLEAAEEPEKYGR